MAVQTQIQVRRGTASSWTSTNPTLAAGEIGFESDTGKIKVGTGSATWSSLSYIGAANAIQYVYTATAGQTTFSGTDSNGLTLSYTVGAEQVYVNGVLQVRTTDYTATNGTSVVLTSAALVNDIVTIVALGTFTVADTYTQAQVNAAFQANTNNFAAGKNKIINGDFSIWQRGTSFTSSTANTDIYTADRWVSNPYNGTITVSRQTFTPATAPVSGYEGQYFLRFSGTNNLSIITQRIEDVRTFAGQTATISFWAKAASALTLTAQIGQRFGSGGSADVYMTAGTASLTTSWTRFSITVSVPSVSNKTIGTGSMLQVDLYSATLSNNIDIWGVQLEAGSVATAFQTATGTIQGELAACQRYYQRITSDAAYGTIAQGKGYTTGVCQQWIPLKVPMRVAPSAIDTSAASTFIANTGATDITSLTSIVINTNLTNSNWLGVDVNKTSSFTVGAFYVLYANNSTTSYIGASAEL